MITPTLTLYQVQACIRQLGFQSVRRTKQVCRDPNRKYSECKLQKILEIDIEPAPDEWDRLYNVDFFIKIKDKYIGLQIKPASGVSHIPQIFKEQAIQRNTHDEFAQEYGGKVFYIISIKDGNKKRIHNTEVIEEIRKEIERLQN